MAPGLQGNTDENRDNLVTELLALRHSLQLWSHLKTGLNLSQRYKPSQKSNKIYNSYNLSYLPKLSLLKCEPLSMWVEEGQLMRKTNKTAFFCNFHRG